MEFQLNSIEELNNIAEKIISNLQHKIILFEGEMGAGKTTVIKVLLKKLGSTDDISSPTFSIVNEYEIPQGKVFHFDMYRIKSEEEALDFGVEEYLYSGEYCLIEWPNKISGLIPEKFHTVKIIAKENQRTIIFV